MAHVPKVLIIGDDNVKSAIPKVRMEIILGQGTRFAYCTKMSTLTEEISLVTPDTTKVIIVSCMGNIVSSLSMNPDVKSSIERSMSMFGTLLYDIHRTRQGQIKIFVAPSTPRNDPDFDTHNKFALRCLSDTVREIPSVSVLSWATEYELRSDGFTLSEASQKQYLEDLLLMVRRGMERPKAGTEAMSRPPIMGNTNQSVSTPSSAPRVVQSTPNTRPNSIPSFTSTPIRIPELSSSISEDVQRMLSEDTIAIDQSQDGDRTADKTIRTPPDMEAVTKDFFFKHLKANLNHLEEHLVSRISVGERIMVQMDTKLENLETTVATNRVEDIHAFGDQSERHCFQSNLQKGSYVLLTGLKSLDFPKDIAGQNSKTVDIVRDLIKKVLGREEEFSLNVRKSAQRRYAKESPMIMIPPVEVKLSSIAVAQELRAKGAALSKARAEGFGGIYFGQCTTLATRIRCEILRSLCKVLNAKDSSTDSYCIGNATRPLMSYGPKGKGNRRTYLYVEALRRFPEEVKQMDLRDAYKKALPTYAGRMEHTFVILKDSEADQVASGSNNMPLGNKRQADDDEAPVRSPKRANKQ